MSKRKYLAACLGVSLLAFTYGAIRAIPGTSQQPSKAPTCQWSDYAPHGSNCK